MYVHVLDHKHPIYISTELKPGKYESFLSLRGLARFTECCLVLWRMTGKQLHRREAIKVTDMPDELSFSVLKLHHHQWQIMFHGCQLKL